MSQLSQLKESVNAVAQSSRGSAAELQRFIQEFNRQIGEVQAQIDGGVWQDSKTGHSIPRS